MQKFILRYRSGQFVQRDDSTGPMSSGGYPYPVDDIDQATMWDTAAAAAQYASVSSWRDMERRVYEVEFSIGEAIEYPEPGNWEYCNHNCPATAETTAPTAAHFLDCPVWAHNKH